MQQHAQIRVNCSLQHINLNLGKGVEEGLREVGVLADHLNDTVDGLLHDRLGHLVARLQAL